MSKELTALERYNANMEGEVEPDPIERLMFFLSLALTGQDWLDVEQFIDEVSQQLASRDAEVAELQKAIDDNWVTHQQIVAANKERDQLREQVKMLRCECGAARYKQERTVRILTGIHALLYPPRFTDSEGRMWQFKSPIVEEQMQKLSDKIRTIPDEIEALAIMEPK